MDEETGVPNPDALAEYHERHGCATKEQARAYAKAWMRVMAIQRSPIRGRPARIRHVAEWLAKHGVPMPQAQRFCDLAYDEACKDLRQE
jgi:hypothetical protein